MSAARPRLRDREVARVGTGAGDDVAGELGAGFGHADGVEASEEVGELLLGEPAQHEVLPVGDPHLGVEVALDLREAAELVDGDVAEPGVGVRADRAVGPAADDVGGVPPAEGIEIAELDRRGGGTREPAVGAHRRADARRRVARALDDLGDPARVRGRRREELALLEDALAQLVDAHRVDEPLQPGAELVVAVAVVALDAQDRFDRGKEIFTRRELLQRLRGVRVRTEPAGHEHLEAGLDGAVGSWPVHRDHADVVEHRLTAVGGAAEKLILNLRGSRCEMGLRRKRSFAASAHGLMSSTS